MNELHHGQKDFFSTIDRRTWKKYLFYGDILVWCMFVVAATLVMSNLYLVGWARGEMDIAASDNYWWNAMTALGFMVAALSWLFFRFWKNAYLALKKPF